MAMDICRPWQWPAKAGQGRPWLSMAGHGGQGHIRFEAISGCRRLQEHSLNKPPGEGNSQNRQILSKIEPERDMEMRPKHKKSLPNGRQQGGAFGAPQGGGASRRPLGVLVVFHLVRISYVFGPFPGPCWTPTAPRPPMEITTPSPPTSIPTFTVRSHQWKLFLAFWCVFIAFNAV